jgi:SAM-dependent methyltransferase
VTDTDTDGIGYADGAESAVLSVLRAATDVSAGSPELAAQVTSHPLAYHLSPQRLGLLAPLRLRPGSRVVDVGCGTGVLTRALAEAGAEVTGIEGTPDRAAAAMERCRDLPGVRIVRDTVTEGLAGLAEVDLALMCGLLEYSGQYEDGPLTVLHAVADALAARGVLVLAIENQLGLKYLLGGAEDHLGKPWVGLADYPGDTAAPRTWTRAALAGLLADAGLTAQRWLLPYPDYKLPKVVLDERIFDRPDAAELVDKLVRDPLAGGFGDTDTVVAPRTAHRLAMADGVGAAVASSFLVLAGFTDDAVAQVADPALGWLVSGGRRPEWRRTRAVTRDLVLTTVRDGSDLAAHTGHPWLRQHLVEQEDLVPGVPLDGLVHDALRTGDEARLAELLGDWRTACLADARKPAKADLRHPYLPGRSGVPVLPPDHIDVHPGNFIVHPGGELVRVDREWCAGDGVDAELALLRALLETAREVLVGHVPHPWSPTATLHEVHTALAEAVGLGAVLDVRWPELVAAEARFQEAVTAAPATRVEAALLTEYDRPTPSPLWDVPGGLAALRHGVDSARELRTAQEWFADRERTLGDELARQHAHIADLTARLTDADQDVDQLRHEAALREEELAASDDRLGMAFGEIAAAVEEAGRAWAANSATSAELAHTRGREADVTQRLINATRQIDALHRSKPVRLAARTLWPAGRVLRGARDLLLNRPGEEPDKLLRRAGALAPAIAARYRGTVRSSRDDRLYFDLPVPSTPVAVGRGQVVELTGWVAHADMPVRSVTVAADGHWHAATVGHQRLDVVAVLGRGGVTVPSGTGVHVRLPLARVAAPATVSLRLLVELVDGTELDRPLPPLRVRPADPSIAVPATWPGTGPKVAVCLATYRPAAAALAAQLDSLRAQTHPNWVCVVCDDGSPAESVALIRELIAGDERFTLVTGERNVGFYRNFERALRSAPEDATAIALCDQDDVWDADKLATLVARLADPAVTLAYHDMRLIDADGADIAPSFWDRRVNQWRDLSALLMLNTVTGAASLVRADVVRDLVLPFPPGSPSAFHDQWLAACALAAGRIDFVDRPLQSYRQHAGNVTGRRQDRLDAGLPGPLGWLRLGLGSDRMLSDEQRAELGAVTEYELRRVAQFAEVLRLRLAGRLPGDVADDLADLAAADRRLRPLLRQVVASGPQTAGAERRLLAAAVRSGARRRRDRRS